MSRFAVKFLLFNHFPNLRMQEVSDVFPCLDATSDECSTDFQQRSIDGFGTGRKRFGSNLIRTARINQQVMMRQDFFRRLPLRKRGPIICPDDKIKLAVGIGFCQMMKRIDRIRRAGETELEIGSHETRIACHGSAHHFQPQVVAQQFRFLL